jgi:hypothetical protein
VLARDGKLVIAIMLAMIMLPQVLAWLISPPPPLSAEAPPSWFPLVSLFITLVGLIGEIAVMRLVAGPSTHVGDAIGLGARRVWPAFGSYILLGIAMIIIILPLALALLGPEQLEAISQGVRDPELMRPLTPLVLVIVALFVPFQMILPAASVEAGGSWRLLKRSWALTRGHYWRLFGFLLTVIALSLLVWFASQMVGGVVGRLAGGEIAPFTMGALLSGLVVAGAQTAVSTIVSVMLARIYVQLAGPAHADVSVPSSGT